MDEEGDKHEQLKREHICHQWQQLEEMDGTIDGPDAAGMATCCHGRRAAEMVERPAVTEPRPEDTAVLFRRNEEGRFSGSGTSPGSRVRETACDVRGVRPHKIEQNKASARSRVAP